MQACDVLIVGGGPAGSSCARTLVAAGVDVRIMDKRAFPRDKICAGWVTPQVFQTLAMDPDDYGRRLVLEPITGFRTGLMGRKMVRTDYGTTVSYGIRRCEFDHELLIRCGAAHSLGQAVRTLRRQDDHWIVNDQIQTRLIVGAGGHFCPVARLLGARCDRDASVVAAQEVEFELDDTRLTEIQIQPQVPELYFCQDLKGYGWCFRKGRYLNIGLGRVDTRGLASHLQGFLEFLRQSKRVRCQVPKRPAGHAYQLYERTQPRLFDDRVLLVGDAAGLAYPQSGEGIRPAIESGVIAAQVILAADGDYRRDRLACYHSRIQQRLGQPRAGDATRWLPQAWLGRLAAGLLSSKAFARHVVLDRWFLHTHQHALL